MWLLLLILLAGLWNIIDASISIAARIRDFDDKHGLDSRQRIEFSGRVIRGLFGCILAIVAFFLALAE